MNKNNRSSVAIILLAAVGICTSLKQQKDQHDLFKENSKKLDFTTTAVKVDNDKIKEILARASTSDFKQNDIDTAHLQIVECPSIDKTGVTKETNGCLIDFPVFNKSNKATLEIK